MHAGLVNQLMACYWLDQGFELQSPDSDDELMKTIDKIRKRKKPKFDF
jgi:uncharacterized protein YcgL (UPF0745 family)